MQILINITLISIVLKDSLSIVSRIYPSLSFITILPLIAISALSLFIIRKLPFLRLTIVDILFFAYLILDASLFTLINYSTQGQNYDTYHLAISIFFSNFLPLIIYITARAYPWKYINSLKNINKYLTPLVIFICALQFYLSFTNKDILSAFLIKIYEQGAISYPLQTHENGFEIRLSGIFYSSLGLALYLLFAISESIEDKPKKRTCIRAIKIISLAVGMWFSYNRAGLLALVIFSLFWLLRPKKEGRRAPYQLFTPIFSTVLLSISILLPILSHQINFDNRDSSAALKSSTFSSRLNTWSNLIDYHLPDLLFGNGYIQGLGSIEEQSLMVDNLFLSKSLQSGIISALSLYFFLFMLSRKAKFLQKTPPYLFYASLIMLSVNNIFSEINYIVLIFGAFVANISINSKKIININEKAS